MKQEPEFELMEEGAEREKYWIGKEKKFVRSWMYVQRGLNEFNEFKYLGLVIIGEVGFLILKVPLIWAILANVIVIPIALIVLWLFGRWHIHKAQKTEQWVQTQLGSVLEYRDYNLKVRTLEVLKEISKKLDK